MTDNSQPVALASNERAKPLTCPFCREAISEHSDEAFWFNGDGPPPCYAVRCDNCGAQGPYGYGRERGDHWGAKDEAAKRWNDLPRPAHETSEWRPIDTAVTDECNFEPLLGWDGEVAFEMYHDHTQDAWYRANTHRSDAHDGRVYPTHWQPMPGGPPVPLIDRGAQKAKVCSYCEAGEPRTAEGFHRKAEGRYAKCNGE